MRRLVEDIFLLALILFVMFALYLYWDMNYGMIYINIYYWFLDIAIYASGIMLIVVIAYTMLVKDDRGLEKKDDR